MKNMLLALALSPVIIVSAMLGAVYAVMVQINSIIKTGEPS